MAEAVTEDTAVDTVDVGAILEADFWPEPVRVLAAQSLGSRLKVEAAGIRTHQLYSRLLAPSDLTLIRMTTTAARDFDGRPEAFFLAVEAQRIRYAFQFGPLFAVNVSQVDALPHQIEAVYHYILRQHRVRFLLADDPGAGKTMMWRERGVLAGRWHRRSRKCCPRATRSANCSGACSTAGGAILIGASKDGCYERRGQDWAPWPSQCNRD